MDTGTRRVPGMGLLVTFGVIVLTAIVAVAVLGGRRITRYEPGTPEAAAQSFVQAVLDGDLDAAHGHLAPELQDVCSPYRLDGGYEPQSVVVTFEAVRIDGARATIEARLEESDYSPDRLPFEGIEIGARLVLEQHDGEWLIVFTDWPHGGCAGGEPWDS